MFHKYFNNSMEEHEMEVHGLPSRSLECYSIENICGTLVKKKYLNDFRARNRDLGDSTKIYFLFWT